jgi:hypothetical protein
MLKLYKRENGRITAYHEAWVDGAHVIEHFGPLGERGTTREYRRDSGVGEEESIRRVLAPVMGDGFEAVDADDHALLLVEFASKGPGTAGDVKRQGALHSRLNEMLGWTGLGHVDGGSVGSGTMEVCCVVVDFEHARQVIEANLAGTEFADYTRIYDERREPDA